jgi:hypothetical protein
VEKDLRQLSALLHCSLTSPPAPPPSAPDTLGDAAALDCHGGADSAGDGGAGAGGGREGEGGAEGGGADNGGDGGIEVGEEANQRRKYVMLCESLMACKGTVLALQDARTFTKAICSVPRHTDDKRFPQVYDKRDLLLTKEAYRVTKETYRYVHLYIL